LLLAPSENCWKQDLQGRIELTFKSNLSLPEGFYGKKKKVTRHTMAVSRCRSNRIASGADMNQKEIQDCSSRKIPNFVLTK